jgi:hypothetical protein
MGVKMKVVINACYGGFGLSPEAELWLYKKGYKGEGFACPVSKYFSKRDEGSILGKESTLQRWREYKKDKGKSKRSSFVTTFTSDEKFVLCGRDIERDHPLLIECVETLKEKANGLCAKLKIVEIPDNVEFEIDEYDGKESIGEQHRSWS